MDSLKQQFKELEARVAAMSQRERIYLLVIVCVVCYGAWDFFLQSALSKEKAEMSKALVESRAKVATAAQLTQAIIERQQFDPNREVRQRFVQLEREMEVLEAQKREIAASFLSAYAMGDLLQELLKRQGGLNLIGLETLRTEPLITQKDAPKKEADLLDRPMPPMIYRHALAIELEGSYFDLIKYLKALETQPLFWDAAEFVTTRYPMARVKLRVYTLSFEKEWLGV